MMKSSGFLIALLLAVSAVGDDQEFTLRNLDNTATGFLVPAGWELIRNLSEERDTFVFMPPEPTSGVEEGIGLMVVIYKGIGARSGLRPSMIARNPSDWVGQTWRAVPTEATPMEMGPFQGSHVLFYSESEQLQGEEYLLANDETDQLWSIAFIGPRTFFPRNWAQYGDRILSALALDDEYGSKGWPEIETKEMP